MSIHQLRAATEPCLLNVRGKNRLLSLLPAQDYEHVRPLLEEVSFDGRVALFKSDEPLSHVYFPLTAVASLVLTMDDGDGVEVGTVGNEGLVGVPLTLGADRSPAEAVLQIPGDLLRITADAFRNELDRSPVFSSVMRRYSQAFFALVSQSTGCNRLHPVEQRLCRWILMTHDRVGADHLPLTQEFIAIMLGVRRASVSVAAGILQKAGMIRYRRGTIDVVDRQALEEGSCECYARVRSEYERLLC
jgi:CRP-like cAMP-binding protein